MATPTNWDVSYRRLVLSGFVCVVLVFSGCSSKVDTAKATDSSVGASQATSDQPITAPSQGSSVSSTAEKTEQTKQSADDGELCDAIDQSLTGDSASTSFDEVIEEVVVALPTELRSDYETFKENPDNGLSDVLPLLERIDVYTTERCGVPYMRTILHQVVPCISGELGNIDSLVECGDLPAGSGDIRTLEELTYIIDELGRQAKEDFEELERALQ